MIDILVKIFEFSSILFLILFIIVTGISLYFILKIMDKITNKLLPLNNIVKLTTGEKVPMVLYRTYRNGKVFKHKDKLIITDHTNVQIPCIELEMLQE